MQIWPFFRKTIKLQSQGKDLKAARNKRQVTCKGSKLGLKLYFSLTKERPHKMVKTPRHAKGTTIINLQYHTQLNWLAR